ncbi:MAG TPA: recombinase family protein [Clostridiales bacterium]|nr:recombinase family protein [Clostridiales bacterium]
MSIAAIYGRKSVFTGKGESVQNQLDACREYALRRNWKVIEYFDEGFSGKDTDRPGFQKLLADIEKKKIDYVIFYKLDRISRNMRDILDFIERTTEKGIDFISITENFDTTTPFGRAMLHIAATFAQLEREMLQQRVRDNMLRLSKMGRWLGGNTPTGYRSKRIEYIDQYNRKKYMYVLEEIPEELQLVKTIYQQYLKLGSLGKVEKYLRENNLKTKNGKYFQRETIKGILKNPVYIQADRLAYEYFQQFGIHIASPVHEFDGIRGVLTYNKNIIKKGCANKRRDYHEWILVVSNHKGIIPSQDWINIQNQLEKNKKYSCGHKSHRGLLTGLLRCECGALMRIKYGQKNKKSGKRFYYYVCSQKNTSAETHCNAPNIRGDVIEELVLESFRELPYSKESGYLYLKNVEKKFFNNQSGIIQQFELENKILKQKINENANPSEKLKNPNETDETRFQGSDSHPFDLQMLVERLLEFPKFLHKIEDVELKQTLLKATIEKIIWKWSQEEVQVYFFN